MNSIPRRRTSASVYAPNLVNVWIAAGISLLGAGALLASITFALQVRVDSEFTGRPQAAASSSGAVQSAPISLTGPSPDMVRPTSLDVLRTALTLGGFFGAVLAGVYAYRKQRLAEGDSRRADDEHLGARFTQAAELLGNDKAAVRLAGAYGMAALADDWPTRRQTCVDVLTAYLRVPLDAAPPNPDVLTDEIEVRRTIVRIVRDHLRPGFTTVSWQGLNLRFEGAHFYGGDLTGSVLSGGNVSFYAARFLGSTFHFNDVRICGSRVWMQEAQFESGDIHFDGMKIESGLLTLENAVVGPKAHVTLEKVTQTGGDVHWGPLSAGSVPRQTPPPTP